MRSSQVRWNSRCAQPGSTFGSGKSWPGIGVSVSAVREGKSNLVPAPGLEPGRPSFKGWWAANYPTPDSEHLVLADAAVAATVKSTIPAGPSLRYQRSLGIERPAFRSCDRDPRSAGRRCAGTRGRRCPRSSARSPGVALQRRGWRTGRSLPRSPQASRQPRRTRRRRPGGSLGARVQRVETPLIRGAVTPDHGRRDS